MSFTEKFKEAETELKGLGLEAEALSTVTKIMGGLSKEHNSTVLTMETDHKAAIETEKHSLANLQSTIDDLKKNPPKDKDNETLLGELETYKGKVTEFEKKEQDNLFKTEEQNKLNAIKSLAEKHGAKLDDRTLKGYAIDVSKSESGGYIIKGDDGRVDLLEDDFSSFIDNNKHLVTTTPKGDGSGEGGKGASTKDTKVATTKDIITELF